MRKGAHKTHTHTNSKHTKGCLEADNRFPGNAFPWLNVSLVEYYYQVQRKQAQANKGPIQEKEGVSIFQSFSFSHVQGLKAGRSPQCWLNALET